MPDFLSRFLGAARSAAANPPVHVDVPQANVDVPDQVGEILRRDQHYFQLKVNELYSATSRNWFQTHVPMVIAVSEFGYAGQQRSVPVVVGPSLVERHGLETPDGILLRNTRVAGLHPYAGGRISLTLVLHRLPRENLLRTVVELGERVLGALDFATALMPYLGVAHQVLEGIGGALSPEDAQAVPVLGARVELDADGFHPIRTGYRALIALPESEVDPSRLFIRDDRLCELIDGQHRPFRRADYVLWSLVGPSERSDLPAFPFYDSWELARSEATKATEDSYHSAKVVLAGLYRTLLRSPDVTDRHARALKDDWLRQLRSEYEQAVADAELGSAGPDPDRADALAILQG